MGQRYTVRHLNHVRSPLLSGYIRPKNLSYLNNGLLSSPLAAGASSLANGASTGVIGDSVSAVSDISQLLSSVVAKASSRKYP